jgi:predicted enzyme related to lactoylglutathione lyase
MRVTEGITWIGVCTENFEETVAFFKSTMGLKLVQEGTPTVDIQYAKYCVFDSGNNLMFEIFQPTPEIANRYSGPVISFTVDDLDAACQEMKFITPVIDDKATWRWIYFQGPDKNIYQIQQRY